MKIIIALLVPILLGIVAGSNLVPTMTLIILNQPTIALPIGVWLTIAIGLGLLSSIAIQLLIAIDRQSLKRQIRQLQSRSPQDEDVFTRPPSAQPIVNEAIDDIDDWENPPVTNRQLDWEDSPLPRPQNRQAATNSSIPETDYSQERQRQNSDRDRWAPTSSEVYDADFRLIQPPYKQPLETEFDDDLDSADFEYDDPDRSSGNARSSVKPSSPSSIPASNLDDEDWGFDFENRDTPAKAN